jgi:hypothetical protein
LEFLDEVAALRFTSGVAPVSIAGDGVEDAVGAVPGGGSFRWWSESGDDVGGGGVGGVAVVGDVEGPALVLVSDDDDGAVLADGVDET